MDSTATRGASSQKLTPTAFWALSSAVSDSVRPPLNRQITMTLASPSTAEERAHPTRAIDPALTPAASPTAPSIVIHARLAQASRRVHPAIRSHDPSALG